MNLNLQPTVGVRRSAPLLVGFSKSVSDQD